MHLHDFIIDHSDQWMLYERPAVDWYGGENGRPRRKLQALLQKCPLVEEAIEGIPHQLNRQAVRQCYQEDLYKGFVATILWDVLYRDHVPIGRVLPLLSEPAESIRRKLEALRKHLCREESLSYIYEAANSPNKLQIAQGVGSSVFTQVLFFLSSEMSGMLRPVVYNYYMMRVHCALLVEETGSTQPFYREDDGRVKLAEGSTEAECYEAYCRMLGDLALAAGSGNPELLVDWLIYSDDSMEARLLAREAMLGNDSVRQSTRGRLLAIEMPPIGSVDGLNECPIQDYTDQDVQVAEYASTLYTDSDEDCALMYRLLERNGLVEKRTLYADYNRMNRGCSMDNPFIIDEPVRNLGITDSICEYILHWTDVRDKRAECSSCLLRSHEGRKLLQQTYNVFIDGCRTQEHYYFDVVGFYERRGL